MRFTMHADGHGMDGAILNIPNNTSLKIHAKIKKKIHSEHLL